MTDTINNGIPFVPENTIDPAAGLNLSLNTIDALLQVLVQTVGANTPPAGVEGQRHIVGTAPTGAWAGQANKLARYLDAAWEFYDARYALNAADGLWYVRGASTWAPLAGGGGGGDVAGPASAVNNGVALFDGITGKLLKDGGVLGSAAFTATADYATAAQGALADTALQTAAIGVTVREKLVADRTYYVRTDGSDSNDGTANNSGGAFLTIQKAVDVAASLDQSIFNVTVQVADGTYLDNVLLKEPVGSGQLYLTGNTATPASAILSAPTGDALTASVRRWSVRGFRLVSTSGNALSVSNKAYIDIGNLEFGTCALRHIFISTGGLVTVTGGYSIVGNAFSHLALQSSGSSFAAYNATITITGSPSFNRTVECAALSEATFFSVVFVGGASGQRYNLSTNAVINTFGSGVSFIPGSTAGVSSTGGQYV